jgi:hypothetical protein
MSKENRVLMTPDQVDNYDGCFSFEHWQNSDGEIPPLAEVPEYQYAGEEIKLYLKALRSNDGGNLRLDRPRPQPDGVMKAGDFTAGTVVRVVSEYHTEKKLPAEKRNGTYWALDCYPDHFDAFKCQGDIEQVYSTWATWYIPGLSNNYDWVFIPLNLNLKASANMGPYQYKDGKPILRLPFKKQIGIDKGVFDITIGQTRRTIDGQFMRNATATAFDIYNLSKALRSPATSSSR